MIRGKRNSNATASSTQVKRPRTSSTSRPTKCKRLKQTSRVHPVPALNPPEVPHPSELSREPAATSSVVSQDMVSIITSADFSAVLESPKSVGIIPQEPVQTSDPSAAVQGSVAQVVKDLTGEGHTLTSTSFTSGPETDHRPDKIHTLTSVPLSSRVPGKIQSKIWANEYIDLGTLLASLSGDAKYNFRVKSCGSNQPLVRLEPVQNSKRITSIDQWTTVFPVLQTSDPSAAVQGSVAQVVQDLNGEGHTLTSTSFTSGPETDHRPDKIHTLTSVPLSSRVPGKIQSKIWANEYIDLGTLLASLSGDAKYNFRVKSCGSNQPLVRLEPVQNSKRITSIDQWTTVFQFFVDVYTIRFPDSAPGLMKYSATVRDLAAKNAHWRYLFPWDEVHMTKISSSNNPPNSLTDNQSSPFR